MEIIKGYVGPELSSDVIWGYLRYNHSLKYGTRSLSTIDKVVELLNYIKRKPCT